MNPGDEKALEAFIEVGTKAWAVEPGEDERGHLPSCSAMDINMNCLPAHNLNQSLLEPPRSAEEIEWASSGERLHAALATGDFEKLEGDEKDKARRMFDRSLDIIDRWHNDFGINGSSVVSEDASSAAEITVYNEKRFWWPQANPVISGRVDYAAIHHPSRTGLVIDWKSMRWGDHDAPDVNKQLRYYAAILPGATRVRVELLQDGHEVPPCDFGPEDIERARMSLLQWNQAKDWIEAKFTTGSHCRWCRAFLSGKCPQAAQDFAMVPVDMVVPMKTAGATLGLTVQRMAALHKAMPLIKRLADFSKVQLLAMSDSELLVERLKRQRGANVADIVDVPKAIELLRQQGFTDNEWITAANLTLGDLDKLYKSKFGGTDDSSKEAIRQLLKPAIQYTRNSDSLKEIK